MSSMEDRHKCICIIYKEARKYGGCAKVWKPNVKGIVVPVECQSNRICVIIVNTLNNVILLTLNDYILCDHRVHEHHQDEMDKVLR